MKKLLIISTSILFMTLTGCEEFKENGILSKNPEGPALRSPEWNRINQEFGLEAFNRLIEADPSSNIVLSPLSIELALSMTSNGARGETLVGMMNALSQDRITRSQVNTHFLNLIHDYNSRGLIELNIANSIWMREAFPFNNTFLETNQTFYKAATRELDFNLPSAKDTINQWVDENTEGRIPEIIDRIDPNAVMFLINAIYFKGEWLIQFDSSSTSSGPFYFEDGSTEDRKYMVQMEPFPFIESEEFIAVSLPFKDSTIGMSFFLPSEEKGLNRFTQEITVEKWQKWNQQLSFSTREPSARGTSTEVVLSLPRFEIEYKEILNEMLKELGMQKAFDRNEADFGNMTDAQVYISEVMHKTFLKIDEAGAEAAAVTSVGVGVTSGPPDILVANFNRPFVVVLHDYERGNILFIGKIEDPIQ